MTRRRKDPFVGKENVRHFRLVQRPLGEIQVTEAVPSFDEMFEEYDPTGPRHVHVEEELEDLDESSGNYDFDNDDDGEMVDIDAELDQFAEDFIDIEGCDGFDRVKMTAVQEEKVGEAAKYGILLDDRDYDYTKHLRRVGVTPGAVFIQAPGIKKTTDEKKPVKSDFFDSTPPPEPEYEEAERAIPEDDLKANHEEARQQFRSLLQEVGDDPMLREVIEALEDDRYVTGEFDDELVISLDNLNISPDDSEDEDEDDYDYDAEVDILDENEKFPDFIPSEALRRQMEKISAQESQFDEDFEDEELNQVLNEYTDNEDESDYGQSYVDIEGDSVTDHLQDQDQGQDDEFGYLNPEETAEVYKYLKEHGRARGSTLYDKKRPSHLPPIHVAIAQYNELRRELAVNNDLIIKKYAEEDVEETRRQIRESEEIISGMVKMIDDPEELAKRVNIETARYLLKLSEGEGSITLGPKKIVEFKPSRRVDDRVIEHITEPVELVKINKGEARSVEESPEEKRERKAKVRAEKREKRIEKKSKK